MKVFIGPAIQGWKEYVIRILEIGFRKQVVEGELEDSDILVEELGDQLRYIYLKDWSYSFLFSTEPFHHEPKPYTMLFCGNNEMTPEAGKKCVLFPFYWFEFKLNKCLEDLEVSSIVPSKLASAFVSSPISEFRTKVIACLSQMGYLDSYGLIGNNTGGRYDGNPGDKMKEYKFNICFENAAHEAYISEKLPVTLKAGIIPVYWGCPNIDKYFNTERFIWVQDTSDMAICRMLYRMLKMTDEEWLSIVNKPIFPEGGSPLSLEKMGEEVYNYLSKL